MQLLSKSKQTLQKVGDTVSDLKLVAICSFVQTIKHLCDIKCDNCLVNYNTDINHIWKYTEIQNSLRNKGTQLIQQNKQDKEFWLFARKIQYSPHLNVAYFVQTMITKRMGQKGG